MDHKELLTPRKPVKGLRYYRERAGLSREALAKKIKYDPKTISRWEIGITSPRTEDAKQLYIILKEELDKIGVIFHIDLLFRDPFPDPRVNKADQNVGSLYYDSKVIHIAWSSDGTRIATTHRDHTVQVWNSITGKRVVTYTRHPSGWTNEVAWCPHHEYNRVLASVSGGHDPMLRVWDCSQKEPKDLFVQRCQPRLTCVTWSINGQWVACAGRSNILEIWDPWKQCLIEQYQVPDTHDIQRIRWSPDGTILAVVTTERVLHLRSHPHGSVLRHLPEAHDGAIADIAWSPKAHHLFATASSDGTVKIWDTTRKDPVGCYRGHTDRVTSVAWSPDGTLLASVSVDKTVHIWDPNTRICLEGYMATPKGQLYALCWSPDGKKIAFGGQMRRIDIRKTQPIP